MLFGLFFGAGNIIFPLMMGQSSGSAWISAAFGFIVMAAGLPLLGVNALGVTQHDSLYELMQTVMPKLAKAFTLLLYATIGPLFAIPRLATVSHEVGIEPLSGGNPYSLVIFSALFFFLVWRFSISDSNILDIVGKYMNPLFLLLMGMLIVFAILNPMGTTADVPAEVPYSVMPFSQGVQDGYNTMDAIASLAFGIIVIQAVRDIGIRHSKDMSSAVLKSGIISSVLMMLIYVPLIWMGASQTHLFEASTNGGEILAKISNHYFSSFGAFMLFLTVTVACLKTGIGLITAMSDMLLVMFPQKWSFKRLATVLTILSFLIANVGLEWIITLSLPVLMFIYPLTIVIILIANFSLFADIKPLVYQWSLGFTLPFAILDALDATPLINTPLFASLIEWLKASWPLFENGFGWLIPAVIGAVIGAIISRKRSFDFV